MTRQELFTTIANHLLTQNARSMVPSKHHTGASTCLYRSPDGLKCAAGAAIPDDVYDPSMEQIGIRTLIQHRSELRYLEEHGPMLQDLQNMHDREQPRFWPQSLGRIAAIWGVEFHAPATV